MATKTYAVGEVIEKNAIPVTTARAAPLVTPRMPGSASGLRVTPCITAPDSPSAAPISRARSVRGTRFCTAACAMPASSPVNADTISSQPTSRAPKAIEARATRAATTSATANQVSRDAAGRRAVATSGGGVRVLVTLTRPCRRRRPAA